jgi:processive 1,2-diacylglycerol beta-glucosyltransferase
LSGKTGRNRNTAPLFGVVTDFAVHALWIVKHVDCYYVATEEARRQLLRKGLPDGRIRVTGIPVDPVFSTSELPRTARRKLGLDRDLPTVLLLSGGFGVGPTVELMKSVRELKSPFQLLVVAGANEKMRKEASAAANSLPVPCKVYGFVNNMHELVDAADVVVSKPGGLTASEVTAKGRPLIVIDPIPGQEQRNCEILLESGAAMRLFETADLPYKLELLLGDPARLARLKESARRAGRPRASQEIVRDVIRRLAK